MTEKLYYKIGEVARITELKAFVLRYWETEFPLLQPTKTPKGQRIYRREDIDMILRIKDLLYSRGFTIAGARRSLELGTEAPEALGAIEAPIEAARLADGGQPFPVPWCAAGAGDGPEPRPGTGDLSGRAVEKALLNARQALQDILTILGRDA